MHMKWVGRRNGFTIIELLVVVVVVGILAALTIVSYNVVQQNARDKTAQTYADQVARKLASYATDHGGQFPANLADIEVSDGAGVSYQYSVNNNVTPRTYCVTVTSVNRSFRIARTDSSPVNGACPGHGVNGVAAVTNLIKNPKGVGASAQYETSGWFSSICGAVITDVPSVTWGARTDWHRISWNGTGCSTTRLYLDLSDLENGQVYRVSALVGNSGSTGMSIHLDFADSPGLDVVIPAGQTQTVTFAGSRATYDPIYRFIDLNPVSSNATGILITNLIMTKGTGQPQFADGSSPGWIWNGTPNASTSTGPAL